MEQGKTNIATLAVIIASTLSPIGAQAQEIVSPRAMSYVRSVTCDYLDSNLENIQVKLLEGGYSSAVNLQLAHGDKSYVLRINSELESALKRDTELYAMKEAAAAGIAPTIHWISADGLGILMDYIEGGTLTIEQSKKPEISCKIADLMRKVHALPKNHFCAPSFESVMEEFYQQYAQGDRNQAIWDDAMTIIKEGALQLQSLNGPTVNTHGDLNPRNILVSDPDIYFIDWGDGIYTDPFHDLSFFSIMMDYDSEEETYFIECYLGHAPTMSERKRFLIAKKMNFARLVLSGQGIGNQLSSDQKDHCYALEPIREWSYYAQVFANDTASLPAQFFWGQAQVALNSAKALDTSFLD